MASQNSGLKRAESCTGTHTGYLDDASISVILGRDRNCLSILSIFGSSKVGGALTELSGVRSDNNSDISVMEVVKSLAKFCS